MPVTPRATAVPLLTACLLAASCAHQPRPPVTPLQQAWQEARSAGGRLVDSEAALRQRLAALDRFAQVRQQAEREMRCARHGDPELCLATSLDRIEVTGSDISSSDVITNNQEAGIDEGGIVKKSGDYLIVLRKGTLFSIALREGSRDSLRVADRLLAAEDDSGRGVWYDEILALDGRIVLLGYGGGSELIGFDLDPAGHLHRRWHYTLSSNDYYSGENYGMRLHGDRLVFKLSVDLNLRGGVNWPTWRHGDQPDAKARSLVDEHQILLPGLVSDYPDLHLVLVCPLPALDVGRFECTTQGALGDGGSELYVAESAAYLALPAWDDELYLDPQFVSRGWSPSLSQKQMRSHRQTWLVRFPLENPGPPEFVRIRGEVHNQFWLKEIDGDLHALSSTGHEADAALLLHRVRLRDFHRNGEAILAPRRSLPGAAHGPVRLTDQAAYIVRAPEHQRDDMHRSLAVLALRGEGMTEVALGFWPGRLEPALDHLVAVGGSINDGMTFALLPDRVATRVQDQIEIRGHQESEHRSHAFNAGRPTPGRSVFGLPVVSFSPAPDPDIEPISDLLLIDMSHGRLRKLGLIDMASRAQPEPACELSCVDWYGNARLFFVGERIFALSADQLVESRLDGGGLQEVARVRLAD